MNKLVGLSILFVFHLIVSVGITAAQGKIAFTSNRDGNGEIYVMDADGNNPQRLTNNSITDVAPSISPDGSKIVFQSGTNTTAFHIQIMNIDGSGLTPLTSGAGFNLAPSFSPDGSKILFSSSRNGRNQIFVMNANGTNPTALTNLTLLDYSDFPGSFSPDGSKIVFTSNRNGNYEIFTMDANGDNQTKLTDDNNSQWYHHAPSFSPDGSKILFTSNRDAVNDEIYVMDTNSLNITRLTNNLAPDLNPAFSPDGSQIVFEHISNPTVDIYVMDADGTDPIRLTNGPGFNQDPSWGVQANAAPTITATAASIEQDSQASDAAIASVSDSEDAESALTVTVDGGASSTSNGVTISGLTVDASGNVTADIAATCGASNATFTLRVTDSGTLFAEATLSVTVTPESGDPVLSLPSNIVTSLPINSTDLSKVVEFTLSATDNCDAAPQVTADPASGSAFPVGTTTVNVTATDGSGNSATGSFTVTVLYSFAGFFQPVDNFPVVNLVRAGQSVPVKFSLSGNKGLNIFAPGFPASQQTSCSSGTPVSTVEETVTAGSSSLTYDPATDSYIYVWKTQKAWRGTCRQLMVQLNDGTLHLANFQLR